MSEKTDGIELEGPPILILANTQEGKQRCYVFANDLEAGHWGILMADTIKHVAKSKGGDEQAFIERCMAHLHMELADPTSVMTGDVHH